MGDEAILPPIPPDDLYALSLATGSAKRLSARLHKWADTLDGSVPTSGIDEALAMIGVTMTELGVARSKIMQALEDRR